MRKRCWTRDQSHNFKKRKSNNSVATTRKSATKKVKQSTAAVDKREGEKNNVSTAMDSTINKPVPTAMSIAEEAKALVAEITAK